MKPKVILFGLFFLLSQPLISQDQIPIIKANTRIIDIRDGETFKKQGWTITPDVKPDIYTTNNINKKVTFYTDIDSITFEVSPDEVYSFIILLNGTDSAFTQIKYAPSRYLDLLKQASEYNFSDKREIPKFTYQSSEISGLTALRKEFSLDSIAGKGNEISKILNLMHWVHNLITHDGNIQLPSIRNASGMITICKKDNRGLNCRGLATILNECYLSMGIKSRFATCMPKDSVFLDCHVINMVYSNNLKKWIWIDPTNNAYVMNENGELLSIEEVRERLIDGRTLILNPDANWNNELTVVKEDYLYDYMAKNLYRIECPVSSEYDIETAQNGKVITYVELLPLNAYKQTPQKTEKTNSTTGITYIRYITNNPDLFWALPE